MTNRLVPTRRVSTTPPKFFILTIVAMCLLIAPLCYVTEKSRLNFFTPIGIISSTTNNTSNSTHSNPAKIHLPELVASDTGGTSPSTFSLAGNVGHIESISECCCRNSASPLPYCSNTEIRVERLYAEIPFDNLPMRSGWTLGFNLAYVRRRVLEEEPTLEVIVMPQAHIDPGFKETFGDYYRTKAGPILNSAIRYLGRHSDVSFEWSEICYLEMWWRNHGEEERKAFKRAVDSGQLEILTGGWVVADEGNSHYYGLIMQLLEGHEWLRNHMPNAVTPISHYGSDTFGASPTVAYLMRQAGLKQGMAVKMHYAVKDYLAQRRQLEFRWRQSWAGSSNATDFFMHFMPLVGFHVSDACGVDPTVCCQFDFSVGDGNACLGGWNATVVAINASNVAERADMLADQFRKKAQLYKENVIFVPWGEDDRYVDEEEWDTQVGNLRPLFEHINSHSRHYNMHVRFGTPKTYFDALRRRLAARYLRSHGKGEKVGEVAAASRVPLQQHSAPPAVSSSLFPTLSGDFYTLAMREDHYWSGYFTSRPFHKHLDRILQHYLRAADILYTAAINQPPPLLKRKGRKWMRTRSFALGKRREKLLAIYPHLVGVRRQLAGFQHHDAVGGTARDLVMDDFARRLISAINTSMMIIEYSTAALLTETFGLDENRDTDETNNNDEEGEEERNNDPIMPGVDLKFAGVGLPQQRVIPPRSELILFNPLGFLREEVVCVLIPMEKGEKDRELTIHESIATNDVFSQRSRGGARAANPDYVPTKWKPLRHQQIQPLIGLEDEVLTVAQDKEKLCFIARIPALGYRILYLDYANNNASGHGPKRRSERGRVKIHGKGNVTYGNMADRFLFQSLHRFAHSATTTAAPSQMISLANEKVEVKLDGGTGLLRQLASSRVPASLASKRKEERKSLDVKLSFETYRTNPRSSLQSGVYVFMPEGSAQPVPGMADNAFVIVDGPVQKSVVVKLGGPYPLLHTIELDANSDAPTIRNRIDISAHNDTEVSMRLQSDRHLANFYTELNAYQFIRRHRYLNKLPINAHFFPMPGAVFIENERLRLSLMGRQALGTVSLEPGWIEVMLDRRVSGEGYRLGQGVQDNRPTESQFRLLLEDFPRHGVCSDEQRMLSANEATTAYPSLNAHRHSLRLQHPIIVQFRERRNTSPFISTSAERSLISGENLQPDVHLVALRTLSQPTQYDLKKAAPSDDGALLNFTSVITEPKHTAALILHQAGLECCLLDPSAAELKHLCKGNVTTANRNNRYRGGISVESLFRSQTALLARPTRVAEASLTLLRVAERGKMGGNVSELVLGPMEIKSWLLEFG